MVTKIIDLIDEHLSERTSKGLAQALGEAIGDGSITEGLRLPAIRVVADELGLSPSTVSTAWRILSQAGAIRSTGRHGTVVMTRGGPGPARYRRALERSSLYGLDLSTGVPDATLLPSLVPALKNLPRASTTGSYLDDPIIPGLAEVLRQDWPYEIEQFAITDGAMDALNQATAQVLRFGDVALVENPTFPPLLDLLEAVGVRIIGVNIDGTGLIPTELKDALAHRPKALFLQPRAHNPTGTSLTPRRARELAEILRTSPVVVIEDDSAGAIATTPAISLGAWLPNQTVHIRSFSKSHGPDLRIAAMSGPTLVMEGIRERRLLGQGWTSRLLQSVLLSLLTRSESKKQVERARVAYSHRRSMITLELKRRGVAIENGDGLNLWLPVEDETSAMVSLVTRGIGAAVGSPFMSKDDATSHLRLTVGLIRDDFVNLASVFADASIASSTIGPR
jgi:DNA-binding transcriptional MocR family regulator